MNNVIFDNMEMSSINLTFHIKKYANKNFARHENKKILYLGVIKELNINYICLENGEVFKIKRKNNYKKKEIDNSVASGQYCDVTLIYDDPNIELIKNSQYVNPDKYS